MRSGCVGVTKQQVLEAGVQKVPATATAIVTLPVALCQGKELHLLKLEFLNLTCSRKLLGHQELAI